MSITYPRAGWRWLACTGEGGEGVDVGAGVPGRGWRGWGAWHARALSACAGVDVRRCLACIGLACTGDEGVARMWIG